MSDYFAQEASIELGQPADPWRMAEDMLSLVEILFGENWKDVELEYDATSKSNISFRASDLTSLQQRVTEFGGPMSDVSFEAVLWRNRELRSCAANIWFTGDRAERILLSWHMPLRVDAEAFGYGVERVKKDFSRRKRWSEAKVTLRAIRHQSEAEPSAKKKGPQLIKVRGVKWEWRRWFVRNRDSIIVGLSVSTVVSVGVLVLQLFHLLPVPA